MISSSSREKALLSLEFRFSEEIMFKTVESRGDPSLGLDLRGGLTGLAC